MSIISRGLKGAGETLALRSAAETHLLELALRGYTVRRVREKMADAGFNLSKFPDDFLINTMRTVDPALREELDARTLKDYGLARKMERVRRLCEAAEDVEVLASTSSKWSAEYRRFLQQIQLELEPLGLELHVHDSWAVLMQKLVDIAVGGKDCVDQGVVETEG